MTRALTLTLVAALATLVVAPISSGAKRMDIGLFDDRSFGLLESSPQITQRAASDGARIIRTLADWADIAAVKPSKAKNPGDPAYDFSQLDRVVENADAAGMKVLISIYNVPGWANGGKGSHFVPKKAKFMRDFAQAVATRYSGKFGGLPKVSKYTLGNEVNTSRFLMPQFAKQGRKAVGARNYVRKVYLPGYAGLKKGNRKAQIAIGPTSPRGRKSGRQKGAGQAYPATFWRQVANECRGKCKFAAVAHHPYNFPGGKKGPKGKLKWPSIGMTSMNRFSRSLRGWFNLRKTPKIWITEYGFPTSPPFPGPAPTVSKQAKFLTQSVKMVKKMGFVEMYVWFIYEDDEGSSNDTVWQASGGLITMADTDKPSRAAFQKAAKSVKPLK